ILLSMSPKPNVIVLDDAYQHRRVKAGFYILLTAYGDLYLDDYILPAGNLREGRSGAKRASVIIVTKCPPSLSEEQRDAIRQKLKPSPGQQLYFSYIDYDDRVYSGERQVKVEDILPTEKLLVAGIANPKPFFAHLQKDGDTCLTYPDHHYFTDKEIETIERQSRSRIIITTEKDFMRLEGRLPANRLFYLPIKSSFIADADNFDKTILDYVGQSTGNS
ncbi:MAG: tetraacyldisaccharide 4'-kinase, partial [Flavobacterium sp.]